MKRPSGDAGGPAREQGSDVVGQGQWLGWRQKKKKVEKSGQSLVYIRFSVCQIQDAHSLLTVVMLFPGPEIFLPSRKPNLNHSRKIDAQ